MPRAGVSGAGREAKADLMFGQVNESVKAYGIGGHRHVAEIEQELAWIAAAEGLDPSANPGTVAVDFLPHLIPMTRGILSACHVRPTRPMSQAELDALYTATYADEPFVTVVATPPATKDVTGSNHVRIHVSLDRADRADPGHRRRGQPRQGRRGSGDPGLQSRPRPARDGRPRPAAARAMTTTSERPVPASSPDLPPVERRAAIPPGFRAGGLAAGIKASGRPDLAVVVTTAGPAAAAAVFTPNTFAAAPVRLSKAHLAATSGRSARRVRLGRRDHLDEWLGERGHRRRR